jgi:hypothetical protein
MSAIDAVYFDGVTNTAQLVGSAATFLQTFTVMVLARVDSYAGNVRWLQKRTGAPFELRFGFGTGGALTMSADYNTTDLSINSQNNDVIRGRWAWYTAIFNDGSSKLMIQDNEVNSYSFYTAPVGSRVHWGSDDFRVSPTGNRFTGLLDELLVFDYPLTTDQVARIVRMSGVI